MSYLYKLSLSSNENQVRYSEYKHPIIKEGKRTITVQMVDKDGFKNGNPKMKKREKMLVPGPGIFMENLYDRVYCSIWCEEKDLKQAKALLLEYVKNQVNKRVNAVDSMAEKMAEWQQGFLK